MQDKRLTMDGWMIGEMAEQPFNMVLLQTKKVKIPNTKAVFPN